MLKYQRFIWLSLLILWAGQSFASFRPQQNQIYQMVFGIPMGPVSETESEIKNLIVPDEKLLVRVLEVDESERNRAKEIVQKVETSSFGQTLASGLRKIKEAAGFKSAAAETLPVAPQAPNIKYTFQVLHVFSGMDSPSKTLSKDKVKALKADAKATLSKAFAAIQEKMPKLADPALRALAPDPDKFKAGSIIQLDQQMLDYFIPENLEPVLLGTWKVGVLTDLRERSVKLFDSVTAKANNWKDTITKNIATATETSYKLGKGLGIRIAEPGKDAALKVAEVAIRQVTQMNVLDLFSGGSLPNLGSFSKIMPSGIGLGDVDYSSALSKAGDLTLSAAEVSAQLSIMAGEKFLDNLGNAISSMAKGLAAKFSSFKLPSIFRSEFSLPDLKSGLADIEVKLTSLQKIYNNKMAEKTLEALKEFKTTLSGLSTSFANSSEGLINFLQIKRAVEDAKAIYEAQSSLESSIRSLVQVVISSEKDLTTQVKTAFINGIKSGVVEKLSASRLNLEESLAVKAALELVSSTVIKEIKLAKELKGKLDEGMPGFNDLVSFVKSIVGFTSGFEGAWSALMNFSNAAAKVLLRGIKI